jgi:hypothetical protein
MRFATLPSPRSPLESQLEADRHSLSGGGPVRFLLNKEEFGHNGILCLRRASTLSRTGVLLEGPLLMRTAMLGRLFALSCILTRKAWVAACRMRGQIVC